MFFICFCFCLQNVNKIRYLVEDKKKKLYCLIMEFRSPPAHHRKLCKLEDFNKFKIDSKSFDKQYNRIYSARLRTLRDHVSQKAKAKWAQHEVVTLSELPEKDQENNYIVIGILYKHQELKPSALQELSEELQLPTHLPRANYASFKDILYLEDDDLRVKLDGSHMNIQYVITGIICAVFGHQLENGEFHVVDWCYPGCTPKLITTPKPSEQLGKILIISGLDLANNTQLLSLNLLSEWVTGMIGCPKVQTEVASIACIIIAGNSIRGSIEIYNHKGYFETNTHNETVFKEATILADKLDNFLLPIAKCCPIVLMPGEFDPTCHMLPQPSFHPCILPESSRLKSFYGSTNPWIGSINSRIVAGSSGQPIMDITKVAGLVNVSPLTWLEYTLNWRHYAPTAPDTVPAYPYFNTDPFIMTECPDIYFAGNMDKFETKLFTDLKRLLSWKMRLHFIPPS
ncbi:DNA polymerase delta subunit 2 isoform X2 [Lasioglossum baleicum]|uniref:DNA polymerase delta subunit 2 isoform X2 n=1 Tax=Lasioglossum baleicum TaxID=434251 RepID=UPI003FCDBDEC